MARARIKKVATGAALALAAAGVTVAITPGLALATTPAQKSARPLPFRVVPSPSPGRPGLNASTAISATDVWAVGDDFSGSGHTLAEHWNGSVWRVVATPDPTTDFGHPRLVGVSAVSSTDVWAIGITGTVFKGNPTSTFVEHWNGTTWSIVTSPSPAGGVLASLTAINRDNVYAVGYRSSTDVNCDSYGAFVEHWDGNAWSMIPTAATCSAHPDGVSASSASDVWVVGDVVRGNTAFAEHFNGKAWTVVPFPTFANASAVVDLSPTNAWAVGEAISHWDGTSWTVVQDYLHTAGHLSAITSLSATDLWAVGRNNTIPERTFAEQFNGTSWSVVSTPSPATDSELSGVSSAAGGHVFAVGVTFPDNFTSKTLVLENDQG